MSAGGETLEWRRRPGQLAYINGEAREDVIHVAITDQESGRLAPVDGVWVAYYGDLSGLRVYETEVEALRACTADGVGGEYVAFLPFGAVIAQRVDGPAAVIT